MCACVCCKTHALQETSHQTKVTIQASFTLIHPEDPRLARQNQLSDIVLLTITGYSCCLIHTRSFSSVQSCAGTLADIILHYCSWLVVIFTQTCHHYLSSGTATTGPSNWPHKHCQSNCHGNKKKKKRNISLLTAPASLPPCLLKTRDVMFVVGQGLQRWGCPPVFYNRPDRTLRLRQNDSGKASWQSTEELKCIYIINNSEHAFLYRDKIKVCSSAYERWRGEERGGRERDSCECGPFQSQWIWLKCLWSGK